MSLFVKIMLFVVSAVFVLIGCFGVFQPTQFAATLGFELPSPDSVGNIRAMIGAHYIAMGLVCGYAALRTLPLLVFPIGVIEAVMVLARLLSAVNGEFTSATVGPTVIELTASTLLLSISLPHLTGRKA